MKIRAHLALVLTVLLLTVSVPSPGWGGGQDILIGGHNGGGSSGGPDKPGDKNNSTASGYKTARLDAPASSRQEQRAWLSWVREMIRLFLGGRLSIY